MESWAWPACTVDSQYRPFDASAGAFGLNTEYFNTPMEQWGFNYNRLDPLGSIAQAIGAVNGPVTFLYAEPVVVVPQAMQIQQQVLVSQQTQSEQNAVEFGQSLRNIQTAGVQAGFSNEAEEEERPEGELTGASSSSE